MLSLRSINNITVDELKIGSFDIVIFSSGYESRSVYLAKLIKFQEHTKKIVLSFKEHMENEVRIKNDLHYKTIGFEPLLVSSSEEKPIYNKLIEIFEELKQLTTINVLVDYTSMSRLWYCGLLNFFRIQENKKINVYLNYSLGDYKSTFLDYSYSSINSLPLHEGSLSSNNKTLLMLSIGFSPYMIKSVIEEVEPNQIIGVLPIPKATKYESMLNKIQDDILTKDIDEWLKCPIDNLETIFRVFAEITSNYVHTHDLIFLSLGPKIFTLASILVSQRFEQVTCLYLRSTNSTMTDITATGDLICNRITYM